MMINSRKKDWQIKKLFIKVYSFGIVYLRHGYGCKSLV